MSNSDERSDSKDDPGISIKKEASETSNVFAISGATRSLSVTPTPIMPFSFASPTVTSVLPPPFASTASTNNSSSHSLFGTKAAILKPSSFIGTAASNKDVTNVFGCSFSTTDASSSINTFASSRATSASDCTSQTDDIKNCFMGNSFRNPRSLILCTSASPPITSDVLGSATAGPSTSSFSHCIYTTSNKSHRSDSSRTQNSASSSMSTDKLDWMSRRKIVAPPLVSKKQERKQMVKGKYLKRLHHEIHSLKSNLSSQEGTTSYLITNSKGIVKNENGELKIMEEDVFPLSAIDTRMQLKKLLRQKVKQHKNIQRRLSQRVTIDRGSPDHFNTNLNLLETNVNKNSVTAELSPMDAVSVASSTGSMNDGDDADVCFFKSILPDMKSLNDGRKLQFKSHIMSKLTLLISEQKQDLDQSVSSQQNQTQGPSTSQQLGHPDVKSFETSQ